MFRPLGVFLLTSLLFGILHAPVATAHILRLKNDHPSFRPGYGMEDEETGPPSSSDSWLGSDTVATEDSVGRLLQVLQQDPQGAALVAQAAQHSQDTLHEPLWKVVSVCPDGLNTEIGAQTQWGSSSSWMESRDVEESAVDTLPNGLTNTPAATAYYNARIDADRAKNESSPNAPYNVRYFPDLFVVQTMNEAPGICIQKNVSPEDAAPYLFHELVHYVSADWARQPKVEKFKDESDYETQTIQATGDEVDAYVAQWSYQIRTQGIGRLPFAIQPYFTDQGAFIPQDAQGGDNRAKISQLILGGEIFAGGEGYHELRFEGEYENNLQSEKQTQSILYGLLQQIESIRQQNLPYYQNQSAQSAGTSDADSKRAILDEDGKSIQRLPGEEASCKALIDQLGELSAQLGAH